uniref:Putative terminase n=1 Tax=viral metagenome TaxID=1070528 RepID=A0A6H1ZIW8_9ZZZZ
MAMKRAYKPPGQDFECFEFRHKVVEHDYPNRCNSPTGKEFKKRYPTSKHYLYDVSLFWFHYDLICQSDKWRKGVNFNLHWEICKFFEEAVLNCEERHNLVGDSEKLGHFKEPDEYVLEVFRESLKSTYATSCLLWIMGKHPEWTNLYARYTVKGASKRINQIASILLSNKTLWGYYPVLKIDRKQLKKRRGRINATEIQLPILSAEDEDSEDEDIAYRIDIQAEATLNGWGVRESYTGAHINGLVVIDDAVTEDNYGSSVIQESIMGHLAELENIASEEAVKMRIGTPYAENDALQQTKRILTTLQKDEDEMNTGVKVWRHLSIPMLRFKDCPTETLLQFIIKPEDKVQEQIGRDSIVYPEKHSARRIRKKYVQQGRNKRFFYSQQLLLIIDDETNIYREDWLNSAWYGDNTPIGREPERKNMEVKALIDPSGGNKKNNDEMAILVAGIDKYNYIWILEAVSGRWTSKGLMDIIVNLHAMYRPDYWYMEDYGMGSEYRSLIQQTLASNKHNIHIQSLKGGTSPGAKWDRIESGTWPFEMGKVRLQERHTKFIEQYKKWKRPPPPGMPDHLLDLWGYLKNMIFPLNDGVDESANPLSVCGEISTLTSMHKNEIYLMRKQNKENNRMMTTNCMRCGVENAIDAPACVICGGQLWVPTNNENQYSGMDMMMLN